MTAEAQPIALPSALDLAAAGPLTKSFIDRRGGDLEVDASAVDRFGALCLQVLISARKTWAADGKTLSFSNPSDAFLEGLRRFGVPQDFFLPQEQPQ